MSILFTFGIVISILVEFDYKCWVMFELSKSFLIFKARNLTLFIICRSIDFLKCNMYFNNPIIVLTLTSWPIEIWCIHFCKNKSVHFLYSPERILVTNIDQQMMDRKYYYASHKPVRNSTFLRSNKYRYNKLIITTCYTQILAKWREQLFPHRFPWL